MKDFVSSRATSLVGVVASMSILGSILTPHGLPWAVLAWASLALAAGGLLALKSTRSMRQVILDAESAVAVAPPVLLPIRAARASRGKGTP